LELETGRCVNATRSPAIRFMLCLQAFIDGACSIAYLWWKCTRWSKK